uniref:SMP-LTD domain-containing protein n=1 Tax=Wuchereria bancrofti TaxID=6293 RepID=A0AAF5RW06_WUCBA
MEEFNEDKNRIGKRMQNTNKIPTVKFSKTRRQSISPLLLPRRSDDSDNGRFVVSFDESICINQVDQVEKVNNRGQIFEQPQRSRSRSQQILPVSVRETSDCDSDSIASCSSESKIEKTSKKKLRTSSSSVHQHELISAGISDRGSISSNDSSFRADSVSRLSAIFDKAKNRGRQLVHSHSHKSKKVAKNTDSIEEIHHETTVSQDALCAGAEVEMQTRNCTKAESPSSNKNPLTQSSSFFDWFHAFKAAGGERNKVVKSEQPWMFQVLIKRHQILPFLRHRVLSSLVLLALSILSPGFISGFLWGLYMSFLCFLYFFVSGPVNKNHPVHSDVVLNILDEFKEQKTSRNTVYKGWMNELRGKYDSSTYHVNNAQTVLVRLDGNLLRISRPERAVLKHAFHTDPTLTEAEPAISSQSIYNLTGARVTLRPKRLAKRRWWSRKYPIHIRLASRDSEISTFPLLQRSLSANETIELAKSASSSGEECDSNEWKLVEKRKKEIRSPESIKTMYKNDMKHPSQENLDGNSQYVPCTESDEENPKKISSCSVDFGNNLSKSRSLYFFVRSAREKERWFHRLREACSQCSAGTATAETALPRSDVKEVLRDRRFSLPLSVAESDSLKLSLEYFLYISNRVQFNKCIDEVLKTLHEGNEKRTNGNVVYMDLGRNKWYPGKVDTSPQLVMSVNALAARIFYDFCRDSYWCKQVQNKIQSKLATLNLPYFIETLELSNLDLGTTPPEIVAVHSPVLDHWGLWIDFELKYRGGIHLTLETKVNLMKLKEGMHKNGVCREVSKKKTSIRFHHYSDSDLPESPEDSPDEDFGSKMEKTQVVKESTGKKLLNVVDKIASSNIFQGASEFRPVKKMMEGISSTRLLLNVDVIRLEGTMTINIPPPPSDRLWYAFRTPPELSIRSVPQVGDRLVDMSTVSSWIENKLRLLLEKNLVCPNMDDLIVPVMSGNELLNGGYNC